MSRIRFLSSLSILVLTAAACDMGGITQPRAVPGGDPSMLVGPTASVSVTCPSPIEVGNGGPCSAHGYDANGTYTNSTVSAWSSSSTSVATVTSSGYLTAVATGSATIYATIDGITGSTGVQVISAPLTVYITGNTHIGTAVGDCTWYAVAGGGTGHHPYTYSWSQTAGAIGSGSGDEWTGRGSTSFTLYVTVTDTNNDTANAQFAVQVSKFGPYCF